MNGLKLKRGTGAMSMEEQNKISDRTNRAIASKAFILPSNRAVEGSTQGLLEKQR